MLSLQVGSIFFLEVLKYNNSKQWLKTELANENLITLKFPISIPYYPDQEIYNATNGNMEYNGYPYRKIAFKYSTDTLFVQVVPDRYRAKIEYLQSNLISQAESHGNSFPNEEYLFFQILKTEYYSSVASISLFNEGIVKKSQYGPFQITFKSILKQVNEPPPRIFLLMALYPPHINKNKLYLVG